MKKSDLFKQKYIKLCYFLDNGANIEKAKVKKLKEFIENKSDAYIIKRRYIYNSDCPSCLYTDKKTINISHFDFYHRYTTVLAHEYGHYLLRNTLLSKINDYFRKFERIYFYIINKYKIWKLIVFWFLSRFLLYEEILASNLGIKTMRKCGYNEEELLQSSRYLKLYFGTHLYINKWRIQRMKEKLFPKLLSL